MFVSIIMIILNIIFFILFKSFKNTSNEYIKEKNKYYKLKIKYLMRIINIGYIFIYLVHLLLIHLYVGISNIENNYIYLILLLVNLLSYVALEYLLKIKKPKFKIIDKKIIDNRSILFVITTYILFIIDKVMMNYNEVGDRGFEIHEFVKNYNVVLRIICVLLIIVSLSYIINLIIKYREYCTYSYNKDLYLEDIRFYEAIDIKKGFNHLIYISAYIVFFYIRIPYIYIFYILVSIIMMYMIKRKIDKITFESNKLYKTITIAKNSPGIIYAFQFTKDVLLLKKMCIFTIMLVFSIITYYGIGESVFSYTTISIYIILLYTIIKDKVYLIRYSYSLNDSFIDDKKYTINENKKINYIDIIKILNINLYKLIVVDSITYESNIILYDPEYRIEEINIRINKSNIDDYITIEKDLYIE